MKNFNFKTLLLAIGLVVASTQPALAKRIYLNPSSNWQEASAKFAIWYWGGDGGDGKWSSWMTKAGETYYADIADNATDFKFVRFSPSYNNPDFGGDGVWAQGDNQSMPGENDLASNTGWGSEFTWSKTSAGFETSDNGIKLWYNPNDVTNEIKHSREGVSTTNIGTVTDLYLKEYFVHLYQSSDNLTGATQLSYKVWRTASGSSGSWKRHNGDWGTWNSFGTDGYRKPKFGNKSLNDNLLSGLSSGKYTIEYYFDATKFSGETLYCNNGGVGGNFQVTFTYNPLTTPTNTGINVTGYIGGTGTEQDPYLVAAGSSLSITASAAACTDANAELQFKFGTDNYSTTATKSVSFTTSNTTVRSMAIKARYRNVTDELDGGATTIATIYYKVPTYPIVLSGTEEGITAGSADVVLGSNSLTNIVEPTRIGYEIATQNTFFVGENTTISTKGGSLKASVSVDDVAYTDASSKWIKQGGATFNTKWTANTYSISFDKNTGNGDNMSNLSMTYDVAKNLTKNKYTKTGYDFIGWATSAEGEKVYDDQQSVSNLTSTKDAVVPLFAKWTATTYTITYNVNGGEAIAQGNYTIESEDITLPTTTKTGYTFKGWYDNSDLTGDAITRIPQGSNGNKQFWAKWQAKTTTVTLKANGGIGDDQQFTATYDQVIDATGITKHTKIGYDLKGYYAEQSGGSYIINGNLEPNSSAVSGYIKGGGSWQYVGDAVALYAQWQAKKYAITLNNNSATTVGTESVEATFDGAFNPSTITCPEKEDFVFGGYFVDDNTFSTQLIGTDGKFIKGVATYTDADGKWIYPDNLNLYAKWTAASKPCTVNFGITDGIQIVARGTLTATVNDVAFVSGNTITSGQTISLTYTNDNSNPAGVNAYTLEGYYQDIACQTPVQLSGSGNTRTYVVADDVNFYAKVTVNQYTFTPVVNPTEKGAINLVSGTQWVAGPSVPCEIQAVPNAGYSFNNWTKSSDQVVLVANQEDATKTTVYLKNTNNTESVTANFSANTNTAYTVKHYKQNLDGTYPTEPTETDNLTGETDTEVTPTTKNYTGFTAPATQTVTIAGNGSTVVEYQYTRNSHILTWAGLEGAIITAAGTPAGSVKFDAPLTAPTVEKTGYTFNGWNPEVAATMPDNDVTYTAQWTEITSALSTAVNEMGNTAGQANPTITNSVSAIGVTTTATITAEAAKAGYTFEGWTLTNCERTDSNGDKSLTITIKGLGNTEAATVTANYAEDLSTNWKLNISFADDDWRLIAFEKKAGESTGKIAYATVDLSMDSWYKFSIRRKNGDDNYTYFKNANDMHSYNCTNWTFVTTGEDHGIQATISGIYTFKIDFTNADAPVISAIYPDVNCVIGAFNEWKKESNPLDPTTLSTTIALSENVTQAFRIVYKGGYYRVNGTMTSGSCTDWNLWSNGDNTQDVKIQTTVAGDYTFTVKPDAQNANHIQLTITYPGEEHRTVTVNNGETETQVDVKEVTETAISAPQYLNGLRFNGWVVTNSEGVVQDNMITINHPKNYSTHMHGAKEDGLIVRATYTTQGIVYLNKQYIKNNWAGDVYVYFYKGAYWDEGSKGSGSKVGDNSNCISTGKQMTRVSDKSDIYYYDYSGDNLSGRDSHIAFLDQREDDYDNFVACQAIYRGDFQECSPMFVPRDWKSYYNEGAASGRAVYYQEGYWRTYGSTEAGLSLVFWKGDVRTDVPFVSENINDNTFKATVNITDATGNNSYFKLRCCGGDEGNQDYWYGCKSGMSATSCTNYRFYSGNNSENENCGIGLTSTGDYVFILSLADGQVFVSVEYPLSNGDYRLVSVTDGKVHDNGMFYKSSTDRVDTASFFITNAHTSVVKLQKCTDATSVPAKWEDVAGKSINTSDYATGIYNFTFTQSSTENTLAKLGEYEGNFYIRTAIAAGGWDAYKGAEDNLLPYIEYGLDKSQPFNFTHAYTNWVEANKNVKFCIANDYSLCISDTLVGDNIINSDWLTKGANVRFMWNKNTNALSRAYLAGSNEGENFLYISAVAGTLYKEDVEVTKVNFKDKFDWVYQLDVKAGNGATVDVIATYNSQPVTLVDNRLIFSTTEPGNPTAQMNLVYDFKTNRIVAAWRPSGEITSQYTINTDIMLMRNGQAQADQMKFSGSGEITGKPKTVYGAIQFNKSLMETSGTYDRSIFWISFPFDVRLNDVFGLGQYGKYWIIRYYDGAERARKGWFQETKTFWKTVSVAEREHGGDDQKGFILKANEGYNLVLDYNAVLKDLYPNGATENYLFFPSKDKISDISRLEDKDITYAPLTCTITSPEDRRNEDSNWRVIGVPSYADPEKPLTASEGIKFYYAWNSGNNTLGVDKVQETNPRGGSNVGTFQSMHAYMVQFAGTINWKQMQITPVTPATAPLFANNEKEEYSLRLELQQEGKKVDQAYVDLTDEATEGFDLNLDITKLMYSTSQIYSFIGNDKVAANSLPVQDVVVPLCVTAAADGTYTIALPDGTDGLNVTLYDAVEGQEHNFLFGGYTLTLTKGEYNNRFMLNITTQKAPTSIEADGQTGRETDGKTMKFLRNSNIYLINSGRVYNATGAKLR